MSKTIRLIRDINGEPIPVMSLSASHDVDGTAASAKSNAIDGDIVRISAISANIRFELGSDPTATDTSHFLPQGGTIWMPIPKGHKVAVKGGTANIATVGE